MSMANSIYVVVSMLVGSTSLVIADYSTVDVFSSDGATSGADIGGNLMVTKENLVEPMAITAYVADSLVTYRGRKYDDADVKKEKN